jgi:hypothetical protein
MLALSATPTSAILNGPPVAGTVDRIKAGLAIRLNEVADLSDCVLNLGSLCATATINPIQERSGGGGGCCAGLPRRDVPFGRELPSGRN